MIDDTSGMCWDESSDFYGEGIPEQLEKEGYQFSGLSSSNTWGFIYDNKFLDTLSYIASLPEVKGHEER